MEENRKGNTLYAVLGVATLVVAIIGATFAYFSASANVTGDQITGGTSDIGNALSLNVERVLFGGSKDETLASYGNLVPAVIDVTTTGVASAVNAKCIKNDYTGCHLYKITASSKLAVDAADILLKDFAVETTDKEAWKFVVFEAVETDNDGSTTYEVNNLVTGNDTAQNFKDSDATKETGYKLNSTGFAANDTKIYYLLVYLGNKAAVQNPTDDDDLNASTKATGTYSGKVVFNAANGEVVANFSATA